MAEQFDAKAIPVERAPDHRDIYTNNIGIAASNHDIQLVVSLTTAVAGKPANIELATIFMSPSHAKAMNVLLTRAVQDYEKSNGITLPLPDHLKEKEKGKDGD